MDIFVEKEGVGRDPSKENLHKVIRSGRRKKATKEKLQDLGKLTAMERRVIKDYPGLYPGSNRKNLDYEEGPRTRFPNLLPPEQ